MAESLHPRVIALGTFDGLHPGHRAVIHACLSLAAEKNASAMVYTFWENPKALFGASPVGLITAPQKIVRMLEMGIAEVAVDHFDESLSRLSPEAFVDMLAARFQPVAFVCGKDYSFGKGAAGDGAALSGLASKYGIMTVIVPTVTVLTTSGYSSEKVSSTLIRGTLQRGDRETARKLLDGEAI